MREPDPDHPVQIRDQDRDPRPGQLRVLIVDDHAVVRQGMRAFLSVLPDIAVAGEAPDGAGALARLDELGVAHGEIVDAAYGSGLSFRDPDNIALELFARPASA